MVPPTDVADKDIIISRDVIKCTYAIYVDSLKHSKKIKILKRKAPWLK